jgi:uncharacterized protein involved in exopolysaccharide biosynthesis
MSKIVETLFRHKLLFVLPPLLITAILTPIALLTAPMYYEAWASVWVDKPAYLVVSDDGNPYLTPAQNQSARLSETIRTRTFVDDMARRTSLAPLADTPAGEDRLQSMFSSGLAILPNGTHLLSLRFRAQSPQLAYEVLVALIDTFKDSVANDRVNQASVATSFYESRVEAAQAELTKAGQDLQQYIAVTPRLADRGGSNGSGRSSGPAGLDPAVTDLQFGELQRSLQARQAELGRARTSLEQAQLASSAALDGQELGFQVIDPPQMPLSGGRDLRRRLMVPAAGLLAGMALSTVLLVLLASSDRSRRSEAELAGTVRVLGAVPVLRLKRVPKQLGSGATRRAIGVPAGAELPARVGAAR